MLYLYTGTPGHGKTQRALFDAINDERFKGRHVYWSGINGLNEGAPELARWSHLDDVKSWQECEPNSVIFIDECHKADYFPLRGVGKPPDWIEKIAEHRHLGLDFILVTQNAKDVDVFIRRRIETHYHMKRPAQLPYTNVYSFQGYVDCDDRIPTDSALKHEKWMLDKHIWTLYKSADVHTNKAKLPRIVWVGLLLVVGFIAAIMFTVHYFKSKINPSTTAASPNGLLAAGTKPSDTALTAKRPVVEEEESLSRLSPRARVEHLMHQQRDWQFARVPIDPAYPESATIYDEVREIKAFPRLAAAVVSATGCKSYTQQGTPLSVPEGDCRLFAAVGRFNDYYDESTASKEALNDSQEQRSERRKQHAAAYSPPYYVYGLGGTLTLERSPTVTAPVGLQTGSPASATQSAAAVPPKPDTYKPSGPQPLAGAGRGGYVGP
jgi:zona occludens toxin